MQIHISVKTKQKENKIEYIPEKDMYIIHTKEIGKENRANISVIEIVSKHFKVPKGNVKIKRGMKSSAKVLEIAL